MAYFGADGEIRPPRFRARRHAPGHRNSPQDCFYASHCPFRISLLKKRTSTKVLVLFLAQMERFARLASALGGTHPGTETVHRTVSMLRIALFESLCIKKEQAQKCLFFFWRRWRDSNSRGGCPPYALSRGASSPA